MTIKGVGVDLVKIARMRRVVERWQDRFLRRIFTDQELAYCQGRRDPVPHLAARFAAKEAALKALGIGLRFGVKWRELEVRREQGQPPSMILSGKSRRIGESLGGGRLLLSLTHDGDYAFAQCLLVDDEGSR